MAGLDHTGKAGAGGEFAQQATTWTTPTALERSGQGERNKALVLDVKAWATPDCNTSSYSNGLMEPNIRQQAAAWSSPRASDGKNGGPNQRGSKGDLMLPSMVAHWMTPTAQDSEAAGGAGTIARGNRGATLNSQALAMWPTPDVNSGNRDMSKVDAEAQRRPDTKVTIGLPTVASTWPTPSAAVVNDGESPETWRARAAILKAKHGNGNGAGLPLTVATAQWPTPVSSDSRSQLGESMPGRMASRTASPSLSQVVTHSHSLPQALPTPDGPLSSPSTPTSPRHLNPLFGAWLMGWPSTWVIAEPHASSALGTASWRLKQRSLLASYLPELEGLMRES